MTLIINYNLGDVLSVITSDTRHSLKLGGYNYTFSGTESKTVHLTDFTLFSGGGVTSEVRRIKDRLLNRVTSDMDLKECKVHLDSVIKELYESSTFGEDFFLQVMMTGFTKEGNTGFVSFTPENGVKMRIDEPNKFDVSIIAPSLDHMEAIFQNTEFPPVNNVYELPNSVVSYLASIQLANFKINPESVSGICNYTLLFKDPTTQQINFYEGSVDVSEW